MLRLSCALPALMIGLLPAIAHAQDAAPAGGQTAAAGQDQPPGQQEPPPEEEEDEAGGEIVVSGVVRGAVPGPVKPEMELNPADIRSYGASNVSELITALGPQLGSGSGRGGEQPVILLSGRRSSMSEVRDLPTEAIERIDILPEEAALQFGYGANQKVINFVLRRRFQAVTTVLEASMPTAGGNSGQSGNVNIQKISRSSRIQLDVKYNQNSGILESERGVSRAGSSLFDVRGNVTGIGGGEIDPALSALAGTTITVAGVPAGATNMAPTLTGFAANANQANVTDLSPYRTLSGTDRATGLSATPLKNFVVSGVYTPSISTKVSATATLELAVNQSERLLGLPSATLRLPTGNPFSPFSQDALLYRYYDDLLPLSRSTDSRSINGELNLNGETAPWIESWRWSLQARYRRSDSESISTTGIDTALMQSRLDAGDPGFNPFGPIPRALIGNRAPQTQNSANSDAQVDFATYGSLFKLPAGDARATLRVAARAQDQHSESVVANVFRSGDVSRDSASVRGNLTLPLTSRQRGVLGAIGDLAINGNIEIEQLSDFGRLTSYDYGLTWAPIPQVRAIVGVTNDEGAPSAGQLGDPVVTTPNQPVFDFVRNESVDITAINGGNPLLRADSRRVFNARLQVRPFSNFNLNLTAAYNDSRTRNPAESFPGATAEIEAAFPDRFVRDASGRLLSIDYRWVNYERRDRSQLRWGFDFSVSIPSPQAERMRARRDAFQKAMAESRRTGQPLPPEMAEQLEQFRRLGQQQSLLGGGNQRGPGQQGQGPGQGPGQGQGPGGGGGFRGPGGGGGGFGGGRGGFGGGGGGGGFGGGGGGNQVRFSLNHVWVLRDEILIRPGLPVIDRLDGSSGQSVAAHQIDALAAVKRDAWLLQLNGNWQSGTQRMTGPIGSQTRLDFGSLAKVGALVEFNPGQDIDFLVKHPWFRGSRIQLRVENLFDAKQRVTDQNGVTPDAYAPNLRDPLGRVVRLTFRKMFF